MPAATTGDEGVVRHPSIDCEIGPSFRIIG
jgi:hypothetical protein